MKKRGFPGDKVCKVELSIDEIKEIFELQNRVKQEHIPLLYAVMGATYEATIEDHSAVIQGAFEIELFDDQWCSIDLLQSDAVVAMTEIKGDASFGWHQNGYRFVASQKGRYSVLIKFHLPIQKQQNRFKLEARVDGHLKVIYPEKGIKLQIDPGLGMIFREGKDRSVAEGKVKAGGVSVYWHDDRKKSDAETEDHIEVVKAILYGNIETFGEIQEHLLVCETELSYQIYQGGVRHLSVALTGGKVVHLQAEGMKGYQIEEDRIEIELEREIRDHFHCSLLYESELSQEDKEILFPTLTLLDCERQEGYLALIAPPNIETTLTEEEGLNAIDPRELPKTLQRERSVGAFHAFKIIDTPYKLQFDLKRHEELPVLVAMADQGLFTQVFLEDGKEISSVDLLIKNNGKHFLTFEPPKSAKIRSVEVNGEPVKPMEGAGDTILIPINCEKSGDESFPIRFVWQRENSKLKSRGELELISGKIDLPISRIFWQIYLPEYYKFKKFKGNVKRVNHFSALKISEGGAGHSYQKQKKMEMLDQMNQGQLPVSIELPKSGILHQFTALLLDQESLKLICSYKKGRDGNKVKPL